MVQILENIRHVLKPQKKRDFHLTENLFFYLINISKLAVENYAFIQFNTSGSVTKVLGAITFSNSPFSLIRYF